MTDCADIYSFTKDGSRQDSFLKGFKLLTNSIYAQQSGPLFAKNIYTSQTVNILTDPKAMDLRVPESMTNIQRIGITKKKKNIAEYKKNTKVIAVDGEKEVVEDGKIKGLRKRAKFVKEPQPENMKALQLQEWEKSIKAPFNVVYTLAQEIHEFQQKYDLPLTFTNKNELKKHLEFYEEYLDDAFDIATGYFSAEKFTQAASVISGFYKKRTLDETVPQKLTDAEIDDLVDLFIKDADSDLREGYISLPQQMLQSILPPDEDARVEAKLQELYGSVALSENMNWRALTFPESRSFLSEQERLRGISSTDDDYRDRQGILSSTTERALRNLYQGERAVAGEVGGGSTLAGPAFVPRAQMAAPRRGPSYPTYVGPGGVSGQDFFPESGATYRPPDYTGP